MTEREFNKALEAYLTEGYITCEDYEGMNDYQVYTIQAIKRARKRLKAGELKAKAK